MGASRILDDLYKAAVNTQVRRAGVASKADDAVKAARTASRSSARAGRRQAVKQFASGGELTANVSPPNVSGGLDMPNLPSWSQMAATRRQNASNMAGTAVAAGRGVRTAHRAVKSTVSNIPGVRAVGGVVSPIAKKAVMPIRKNATGIVVGGSFAVGAAAGVASGMRDTMREVNNAAGNPVGVVSHLGIRTAFSGNPENSRTRPNASLGSMVTRRR